MERIVEGGRYLCGRDLEELVELEGELVPELALVEVGEVGVPVGEVRPRLPLRLHVLQRHGRRRGWA